MLTKRGSDPPFDLQMLIKQRMTMTGLRQLLPQIVYFPKHEPFHWGWRNGSCCSFKKECIAKSKTRRTLHLLHQQWAKGDVVQRLFLAVAVLLLPFLLFVFTLICLIFLSLTLIEMLGGTVLAPRFAMEYLNWLSKDLFYLREALMFWAAVGALLSWLSRLSARLSSRMRVVQALCGRILLGSGLFIAIGLFLWVLALQWAGLANSSTASTFLGLLPFNDPIAHWGGGREFLATGQWDDWVGRRPVSAAMRLLTLSGGSYTGMIVVQTMACAFAVWLAARSVGKRYGLWSSVIFFGFAFGSIYPYLCSPMSETLGLTLAMLCIPLLLHGLCSRSLPWLIAGAGGIWLSLLCRMGAMFVIPCLGLWFLWICRDNMRKMATVCAILFLILFTGLAYNAVLKHCYVTSEASTASNLSYSFCGLTLGGEWDIPLEMYKKELEGRSEAETASFLYRKGWENLQQQPGVFFNALFTSMEKFYHSHRYVYSHFTLNKITKFLRRAALLGVLYWFLRRRLDGEASFYIAALSGIMLSSAVTMGSDGMRTMLNSFVFFWMIAATGGMAPLFQSKAALKYSHTKEACTALALFLFLLTAGLSVPALVAQSTSPLPTSVHGGLVKRNATWDTSTTITVRGGGWLAGFLVVPDNTPIPKDVPAVSLSQLTKALAIQWGKQTAPHHWPVAPFALLATSTQHIIVGDLRLLTEDAPWWRVTVAPFQRQPINDILYTIPLETMDITR